MALEKFDDVTVKEVTVTEKLITLEAIELERAKIQGQIDALQTRIAALSMQLPTIQEKIDSIRALGVVTREEQLKKG